MARTAEDVEIQPGEVLESHNPATGEVVGRVPITPADRVEDVAREVARVAPGWGLVPLAERLRVIGRAADVVLDRERELAELFTSESGKPIIESVMTEVGAGALQLRWIASWAHRYLSPERMPAPQAIAKLKRHWVVHQPLGVVGVIGPWNYPFMVPLARTSLALAAGNGVVLKPSELTPLSADAIGDIYAEAGLPDGVLRIVHGGGEVGAALCSATPIRKIFFTGSVATGRKVLIEAAKGGKEVQLELGGKDPAIVCADADLDRAVAGVLWTATTNSGQTCAAIERVYVDRRIEDRFVQKLVEAAKAIVPGDPRDPSTQLGPMNNTMQYDKVVEQLEEARKLGAIVECGGPAEMPGLSGRFIAPAVLRNVDHTMRVMKQETFGPLIPVMSFSSEQEAVRLANDSMYGLGASVWTRDVKRGRMLAERLEAGMVWINDHAYSHGLGQAPWGGIKESGRGVTNSKFGLYEMVEQKLIAEDAGRAPAGWWYPYNEARLRGFSAVVESMARSRAGRRARALWDHRGRIGTYVRDLLR